MRFMAAIVMREVLWDLASAFPGGTEFGILEGSFEKPWDWAGYHPESLHSNFKPLESHYERYRRAVRAGPG
jgi:hypothetical protein